MSPEKQIDAFPFPDADLRVIHHQQFGDAKPERAFSFSPDVWIITLRLGWRQVLSSDAGVSLTIVFQECPSGIYK